MQEPVAPSADKRAYSAEMWLDAARDRLVRHGVDSIRVDVLAKEIGVSRGSFYWHFKGRQDLLDRLLDSWRTNATDQVIARFEMQGHDPLQLLQDVLSLPFRGSAARSAASIELAIRAWARSDNKARDAVDDVDSRRISYIAQIFSSLGYPIRDARIRAFALYAYEVAESLLYRQGNESQKKERRDYMAKMLQAPLPVREQEFQETAAGD